MVSYPKGGNMPKRLIAFAAAFALAFAIAGCSSGGSAASSSASGGSSAEASSSSPTSSLFVSDAWPQDQRTEGVPVPTFSVEPSAMNTTDNTVEATYENVPASEVEAYMDQIKASEFTHEVKENKSADQYIYSAYNVDNILDGSMLQIVYNSDGKFTISVGNFTIR